MAHPVQSLQILRILVIFPTMILASLWWNLLVCHIKAKAKASNMCFFDNCKEENNTINGDNILRLKFCARHSFTIDNRMEFISRWCLFSKMFPYNYLMTILVFINNAVNSTSFCSIFYDKFHIVLLRSIYLYYCFLIYCSHMTAYSWMHF